MTRMIRFTAAALAAIGLVGPLSAQAAQGFGFYVGAQGGYSEIGISESDWDAAALLAFSQAGASLNSTSVDKGSTLWGVNAGFQLMRFFAIEAAYYDLGKAKTTADGTALNGIVPIPLCRRPTTRSARRATSSPTPRSPRSTPPHRLRTRWSPCRPAT